MLEQCFPKVVSPHPKYFLYIKQTYIYLLINFYHGYCYFFHEDAAIVTLLIVLNEVSFDFWCHINFYKGTATLWTLGMAVLEH